jgi:hypothetical protein
MRARVRLHEALKTQLDGERFYGICWFVEVQVGDVLVVVVQQRVRRQVGFLTPSLRRSMLGCS